MSRVKVENWGSDESHTWRGLPSWYPNGNNPGYYNHAANGSQELIISGGHPYHLLGKASGDIGGPFKVVRRQYKHKSWYGLNRTVNHDGNVNADNYLGRYSARFGNVSDSSFADPNWASDSEMDALGTGAIARIAPTNPISGLAVTLGELRREGIPQLIGANTWKARTLRSREAGKDYLNYQFGWLPLISEIRTFADTVANSHEIAAKYEQESGKLLHRRFTYPVSIETTESGPTDTYPEPGIKVGYWNSQGKRTTVTTTRVETWFSGAFTYHLPPVQPDGSRRERDLAIANKLYGVRITPEVVWNLTPWSWAADWFTNIGDVMTNISAFQNDGLVMPYGYVMRKHTKTVVYTHTGATRRYDGGGMDLMQEFVTISKSRRKATPYGFGLDPLLDFSTRQWSILAALGLSRGSSGMKYE